MPLDESAPAKLNLYLHVVGRRADGYHLLDSLIAFTDIGDRLSAAPAAALSLAASGPFAAALDPDPGRNLVWRAAEKLAARLGRAPGAALALDKRLPPASGIGGGSSDAAAALRLLMRLWEAKLDAAALAALALELGADVPACLGAAPVWVGGIGERLEPSPPLPPAGVVLANPGVALATSEVFGRRCGAFSAPARFAERPRNAAHLAALLVERRNDLAAPAEALVPAIGAVLAALAAEGALLARMSGSGATCFALFAARAAAAAAARRIAEREPGWWVAAGALLPEA